MRHLLHSILAGLFISATALGQQGSPSLLEQLDQQVRTLHELANQSIVQVQLPLPMTLAQLLADEHPAGRWKDLDPAVQAQLQSQQRRAAAGSFAPMGVMIITSAPNPTGAAPNRSSRDDTDADAGAPTPASTDAAATQPAGEASFHSPHHDQEKGADVSATSSDAPDRRVLVIARQPGHNASGMGGETRPAVPPLNDFALVLDEAGHLLVPIYLESQQLPKPVVVSLGTSATTSARFIASDRQTGLTVLKTDQPIGAPSHFSSVSALPEGSLVLIISSSKNPAHLSIWNGGEGESGVVVQMDGAIAGLARHGQFFRAQLIQPIARQLIDKGRVDRPVLGLIVTEIRRDDRLREQLTELNNQPAMLIRSVLTDSPAASAGMQEGDVLLQLDDQPVENLPVLAALVAQCHQQARLTILRDNHLQQVVVDLSRASKDH
ncbi:MAG: PDZ domain-containing protein [Phycisphaerales bacterium]|nr:PDZ domain-containing protein [Phycisphaerales bacterium]